MSDISELFSRDPLTLTDADIDKIVEDFRSRRHLFNAGHKAAGSTKPKTQKQKDVQSLADELDLDL